jgi:hypothetical protein
MYYVQRNNVLIVMLGGEEAGVRLDIQTLSKPSRTNVRNSNLTLQHVTLQHVAVGNPWYLPLRVRSLFLIFASAHLGRINNKDLPPLAALTKLG